MNSIDCTASVVVYNNSSEMIKNTIDNLCSCSKNIEVHISDNSETQALKPHIIYMNVKYRYNGFNAGYGRGHNMAIEKCSESKYHIIINPDIIISPKTIEALSEFLDDNHDIGMICPKVLNEDGSIQPLNKRYPTVFDLFVRRFLPKRLHGLLEKRLAWYETRDIGYETIRDIEFMSGCFMFCRTNALKAVGGFDDRFFMYFEDADLSRKIQHVGYRTVYYPHANITHLWERASHKSIKMTWVFIENMIRYFNKWGWKWF
jgi:GT2 family glycosyltransferase